jgi:choline-glycine betaine transporter
MSKGQLFSITKFDPLLSGVHGWIIYCLIGLLLGLISFREDLPMTMKSCFYPLIGDRIFGWIGDLIDILSVLGPILQSSVSAENFLDRFSSSNGGQKSTQKQRI